LEFTQPTSILYLSGAHNETIEQVKDQYPIGLIVQPECTYRSQLHKYRWWGADNACFAQGDKFDLKKYYQFLESLGEHRVTCLFATAPDVIGDAKATLERSRDVLPTLQVMGYRPALVGQDGLEDLDVPWDSFGCLFIGGSTEWKLSRQAAELVRQAKANGKWVHMGRVNSYKRLKYAQSIGCDSADGTFVKYGPKILVPKLCGWFDKLSKE
jgi:hypothetical protein